MDFAARIILPLTYISVLIFVLSISLGNLDRNLVSIQDQIKPATPTMPTSPTSQSTNNNKMELREENSYADVVIVGSGLAGLMAAVSAADTYQKHYAEFSSPDSFKIVVLEKNPILGGNSAKATSGINIVEMMGGSSDSEDLFVQDSLKASHYAANEELLRIMAKRSHDLRQELIHRFGINLTDCIRLGGHSIARSYRIPPNADGSPNPVGFTIISKVKGVVSTIPEITIIPSANVVDLISCELHEDEKMTLASRTPSAVSGVCGVKYYLSENKDQVITLKSRATILSTGGFCASRERLQKLAPRVWQLPTTNGAWATGDGLGLVENYHALTRDLEYVQVHPTGFVTIPDVSKSSLFLAPEALRGSGAILLNPRTFRRFGDELAPRDILFHAEYDNGMALADWIHSGSDLAKRSLEFLQSKPELLQLVESKRNVAVNEKVDMDDMGRPLYQYEQRVVYMLMTQECVDYFGLGSARFYQKVGAMHEFPSIEAAAKAMGVDVVPLKEEMLRYFDSSKTADGNSFGKKYFAHAESFASLGSSASPSPVWVAIITPVLHYSMGGLVISTKSEIMYRHAEYEQILPIPGLYGSGEVTGGVHGHNRLGGNSLLECGVFGRISGQNAAEFALRRREAQTKSSSV